MKYLAILIVFLVLVSCSSLNNNHSEEKQVPGIKLSPQLTVNIWLNDSTYKEKEDIMVKITLVNTSDKTERFLFDKPILSTGGPWNTIASVTNLMNNESAIEHQNKAILSSQLVFQEELDSCYYFLKTKDSITALFKLSDIVSFKSYKGLPKGSYEMQLSFHSNSSKKHQFTVQ